MGPTTDPKFSFPVSSYAIGEYLRVKLGTGTLTLAGSTDYELGVSDKIGTTADTALPVKLRNAGGLDVMIASGVIAAGALAYAAASGKVAGSGTIVIGTNVGDATTTDGDHVLILRTGPNATFAETGTNEATFTIDADSSGGTMILKGDNNTNSAATTLQAASTQTAAASITLPAITASVATLALPETLTNKTLTSPVINTPTVKASNSAKTADFTVTAALTGTTFTTVGASGTVTFALPAAAVGLKYRFMVGAAQELRLDPNGSETIALPSTGVQGAAGKYLTANAAGETVEIECCVAGAWNVFGYTGTWTAEG